MNKIDLARKIQALEGLNNEEKTALLELLRRQKKYGLVWEEKPEDIEERLRNELPVLVERNDEKVHPILSDNPDAPNHIIIEGDNLAALTELSYTHAGKIDVIYIDPPYNTGNKDFTYNDNFTDSIEKLPYVEKDDSYKHSKWLSFMSKRLKIAKGLLSERGVIFISIDDNELANLKLLCDEIFDLQNYEAIITYVRKTSGKQDSSNFAKSTEYILIYSNSSKWIASSLPAEDRVTDRYNKIDHNGRKFRETDLRKTGNADRKTDRPLMFYPFYFHPKTNHLEVRQYSDSELIDKGYIEIYPIKPDGSDGRWRWAYSTSLYNLSILTAKEMPKYKGKFTIYEIDYIDKKESERTVKEHTSWDRKAFNSDNAMLDFKELGFGNQDFRFPKSTDLIQHIVFLSNYPNSIYLDFFAGSGTTMQAVIRQNTKDGGHRTCILCTNNENDICTNITYERNKRVIEGYTKPNGEEVAGLTDNNLRYYRTEFLPRERSVKNMRELVQASTGLLCIKNDLYTEAPFAGRKLNPRYARYFENSVKRMLVIYEERAVPFIADIIKNMPEGEKIIVYVFSHGSYAYDDDFAEVADRVTLCALPQAIYNAYQNVLPKRTPKFLIDKLLRNVEETETIAEA